MRSATEVGNRLGLIIAYPALSLEVRVPLLDREVIDVAVQLDWPAHGQVVNNLSSACCRGDAND